MEVELRVADSISEHDAAPEQGRPVHVESGNSGNQEHDGRLRDVENRSVVGSMRRPIESLAQVPGFTMCRVTIATGNRTVY